MASDAVVCKEKAKWCVGTEPTFWVCADHCLVYSARKFARAMMRSHYALPASTGAPPFSVRTAALVKAAHPSVCGLLPLSLVDTDLYMIFGPCSGTLFFREALDCDKLQATLALALEAFPVLAGRVVSLPPASAAPPHPPRTGEWGRGYPRAVDCNNAGAAFTVLDLPGVSLPEDRNAEYAPPFPNMDQGLHLYQMTDNPDAVILEVLVVTFATGSMLTTSAPRAQALCLCAAWQLPLTLMARMQMLLWTAPPALPSCNAGARCFTACRSRRCPNRSWTVPCTTRRVVSPVRCAPRARRLRPPRCARASSRAAAAGALWPHLCLRFRSRLRRAR